MFGFAHFLIARMIYFDFYGPENFRKKINKKKKLFLVTVSNTSYTLFTRGTGSNLEPIGDNYLLFGIDFFKNYVFKTFSVEF